MRSTRGQMVEFKGSKIWEDLKDTLDFWLEGCRDQLENPMLEADYRSLDRLGGIAEALRRVRNDLIDGAVLLIEEQEERE